MITIIDYGVGNVNALLNVYQRLNVEAKLAKTASDLIGADKLILPGVGSFDNAMSQFLKSGMKEPVDKLVLENKVPVLGICVGMQMMATSSEEGILPGLNWINARVVKFDATAAESSIEIPHMGWNDVKVTSENKLFADLDKNAVFYYLHSFYFECEQDNESIATTFHGNMFTAAITRDNIYGVQFHPEKSHQWGEKLLENFAKI